jgi:hypothetical protein
MGVSFSGGGSVFWRTGPYTGERRSLLDGSFGELAAQPKETDEAHLPAQEAKASPCTWVSLAYAHPRWTAGPKASA